MRILIDLDGVLSDLESHVVALWRQHHPQSHAAMPDHRAERTEPRLLKMMDPELAQLAHGLMDTPGLFAALPLVEGAKAGVQLLVDAGHDVAICTSPRRTNPTCASDKFAWVEANFGRWLAEQMVVTRDKTLAAGDLLIDDWPDQSGRFEPTWRQVVFDQPYNRHVDAALRLHGWADLPRLLEQLG